MAFHRDTIFALSSGHGRAGVAVVRVSGSQAAACVRALTQSDLPVARVASLRQLSDGDGNPIDQALVLWFPAPGSFTGEDSAEFQVHGGRAIVEAVLAALARVDGCRPAEPGEFTRRAVENGKLDLTGAEALADLINAETEAQRKQALRQYGGALFELYDGWRSRLIRAAAWAEAAIDFADEDIPAEIVANALAQATEIADEISLHLNDARRGEILRGGFYLTVIGPPNSGKSSLINALAKRDVAIVSDTPGTTRDVLEVRLDLGGYPVIVADTAGLREAGDAIEAEGVRRAKARAADADAVLLLLDASGKHSQFAHNLDVEPMLIAWNKCDIALPPHGTSGLRLSVRTGDGIDQLVHRIQALVAERLHSKEPPVTRQRHRLHLQKAEAALRRSGVQQELELVAEELRVALRELGRLTGRVDVEELLDVVFRDFCIGK
ncbi:MAG TPA: tRNA uridine-5-carboxymethylaminomethyl(34) synthesis GTPase MnmE [Rhizomicrobium sp.]